MIIWYRILYNIMSYDILGYNIQYDMIWFIVHHDDFELSQHDLSKWKSVIVNSTRFIAIYTVFRSFPWMGSVDAGSPFARTVLLCHRYVRYTLPDCTVLYSTVLHCTVLHCTVLYCTVLYCTVLYCTVLYCTVLHFVLHTVSHYTNILYCDAQTLYCTVCIYFSLNTRIYFRYHISVIAFFCSLYFSSFLFHLFYSSLILRYFTSCILLIFFFFSSSCRIFERISSNFFEKKIFVFWV